MADGVEDENSESARTRLEQDSNATARAAGFLSQASRPRAQSSRMMTMRVTLSDPKTREEGKKKIGSKPKKVVLFCVTQKSDLPKYSAKSSESVYRRYTHFRWLHAQLGEKYPEIMRPALPGKVKNSVVKRQESLQRYINDVVSEPYFLLSTELFIFLTAAEQDIEHYTSRPPLPFLQKGWEEFSRNRANRASIWFGQALTAYIVRKDITGQFQSLRFLGEVCQVQERWTAAAKTYRQLLKVAQQMDDHEGAAIALINMARCCHQLSDFNTAVECLTEMLERATEMGQVNLQAVALRNIGMVHASLYDYSKAIFNFREELQLRLQLEDNDEIMKSTEAIGLMLFRMYDVQGAIDTFKSYLDRATQGGARSYQGLALLGLGTFHDYIGENTQSYKYLCEALSIFEEINDYQNATVVLNNIGMYWRRLCQFRDADRNFRQAYNIAKDNRDIEMQTRCLRNLSLTASRADDFRRSVSLIDECVRLAERVNDRRLLAQAYRTQADIFLLINKLEGAYKLYNRAFNISRGTEDKQELTRCLCGLGEMEAMRQSPNNAKALEYYDEALTTSTAIHYKKGRALALYGMGLIYRRLGDFERSLSLLIDATELFISLQNGVMHVRALAQTALCSCYSGDFEAAEEKLATAMALVSEARDKKGSDLINDTSEAVMQLKGLITRQEQMSLKAQRHLSSGESLSVMVTINMQSLNVSVQKAGGKNTGPEAMALQWRLQPAMRVDLDRTPKRFLFIRIPGQIPLVLSCPKRSLLYTALMVLTIQMRACVRQCSATGSCLVSMRANVDGEFTVRAKTASGARCQAGGDHFKAELKRIGDLTGEVEHPVVEEDEEAMVAEATDEEAAMETPASPDGAMPEPQVEGSPTGSETGETIVERRMRNSVSRGASYDITDVAPIVAERDLASAEFVPTNGVETGNTLSPRTPRTPTPKAHADTEVEVVDNEDGTYTCKLCPSRTGRYTLDVTLMNLSIQGAPFFTEVTPADLVPERCTVSSATWSSVPLGEPSTFTVHLRDGSDNMRLDSLDAEGKAVLVEVSFTDPTGTVRKPIVTDEDNGTVTFPLTPAVAGDGSLSISVNGVTTATSPLPFTVVLKEREGMGAPQDLGGLALTLEQVAPLMSNMLGTPLGFAASHFGKEGAWTSADIETFAKTFGPMASESLALLHQLQGYKIADISAAMIASELAIEGAAREFEAAPALELKQAESAYHSAELAVCQAVKGGLWDDVAHLVEERQSTRATFLEKLKAAVPDAAGEGDGFSTAVVSPTRLLASMVFQVSPEYVARGESSYPWSSDNVSGDATDAAQRFSDFGRNECGALMQPVCEMVSAGNGSQSSLQSAGQLWQSLLFVGSASVDATIGALTPLQALLEGQAATANARSAMADDDEDEEEAGAEAAKVTEGTAALTVSTTAVLASMGTAVEAVKNFQSWANAAQEMKDACTEHAALCAKLEATCKEAHIAVEAMVDVRAKCIGEAVVVAARRVLETVCGGFQSRQVVLAALERVAQLDLLEEDVARVQLDVHTMLEQPVAAQAQQRAAILARLDDLAHHGFVELQHTREKCV